MYVCLSVCALYLCLYVCLCLRLSGSLCLSLFRPHADKGRADRRPSAPRARKRTLCLNVRCETQDADMAQTIPPKPLNLSTPGLVPHHNRCPFRAKTVLRSVPLALSLSLSLSLILSLRPSVRLSVCVCPSVCLPVSIHIYIYIQTSYIIYIYTDIIYLLICENK